MRKLLVYIFFLQLFVGNALCFAQDNTYPQVNADHSVTFSIKAPKRADVEIEGSMISSRYKVKTSFGIIGTKNKRDMNYEDSLWVYTTEPLKSDMYTYRFIIDDEYVLDSNNKQIVRDVADTLN